MVNLKAIADLCPDRHKRLCKGVLVISGLLLTLLTIYTTIFPLFSREEGTHCNIFGANCVRIIVIPLDSATGLNIGDAILFNGVKIAEVENIEIDNKNPKYAYVSTTVDAEIPIQKSTEIILNKSQTDNSFIEFSGNLDLPVLSFTQNNETY